MFKRLIVSLLLFYSNLPVYGSINYFNDSIHYFGQAEKPEKTKLKQEVFDWQPYLNPSSKKFFQEGDYMPPAPLMELARNPSEKNIQKWFAVIEAKNKLMQNLQSHMKAYLAKNATSMEAKEVALIKKNTDAIPLPDKNFSRYRFLMYFESSCPHCKRMLQTLEELRDRGYYVEVRQIDRKNPDYPVPFPLIPATKEELQKKKINAYPVLFAADSQKEVTYRLNGYLPTNEVLTYLKQKS